MSDFYSKTGARYMFIVQYGNLDSDLNIFDRKSLLGTSISNTISRDFFVTQGGH